MMSDNNNRGKLYGIGIGPGDPELLTIKAVKILEQGDVICVPKSKEQASTALAIVSPYLSKTAVIHTMEFSMSKDLETRLESRKRNAGVIEEKLLKGQTVVFLTLGDPMLYSTYSYILEHLSSNFQTETIPGIYSFTAISSLLSLPLCKGNDKLAVISSIDQQAHQLFQSAETIVCMKVSAYNQELYSFLSRNTNYQFVMISEAGKENQKVYDTIDVLKQKVPYFSTAIIQKIINN